MAKTAAQRQREWRQRKAEGRGKLGLDCNIGAVADWLVTEGDLQEWDAEDRTKISAALARRIEKLTA